MPQVKRPTRLPGRALLIVRELNAMSIPDKEYQRNDKTTEVDGGEYPESRRNENQRGGGTDAITSERRQQRLEPVKRSRVTSHVVASRRTSSGGKLGGAI